MNMNIELRQREIALPPAMAEAIRRRAEKLCRFHSRIHRCVVTVEGVGSHHRQGACCVSIDVHLPGGELAVRKEGTSNLEQGLKSAFNAMGRRLEDRLRRTRGFVKTHESA